MTSSSGAGSKASKRIAIIGAGCSGLTSIKTCVDDGLEPVCFEMSDDVGGLWNYSSKKPDSDTLNASVYKTCCINTSKEMMCFSDFPMPKEFPPFMPHKKVLEYFKMYESHFQLRDYIQFNTKVVRVVPAPGHSETGAWTVVTQQQGCDRVTEEQFDGVMVCSGHHRFPFIPEIDGREKFQGTVIHSSEYKTPDMFKDKKVVVVGIGNSGADIATDASYVADEVNLSTERGSWIFSRFFPGGFPADALANSRFMLSIPRSVLQWMVELMTQFKYSAEYYGLKPKHRGLEAHPTIHDYITIRIMTGSVKIRSGIDHMDANGVYFTDGSYEECDVVVLATGYEYKFPFLDNMTMYGRNESLDSIESYKYTFLPHLEKPETLCFIGLVQAIGAIMPISELQARWFTRVVKGVQTLPTSATMCDYVQEKKREIARNYVPSRRHGTIETFWVPAMDEIAVEIGAKPDMVRLVKEDPLFAVRCFFGPCVPAQYRLHGEGRWSGAKKTIENTFTNVVESTRTRRLQNAGQEKGKILSWSTLSDRLISVRLLLYMLTLVFLAMMLVDLHLIG